MKNRLQRTLALYALFLTALGCVLLCIVYGDRPVSPTVVVQAASSVSSETNTADGAERTNINTASKEELMALPGIGEVLAERILRYREENGSFFDSSELTEVDGIGQKLLEELEPYICIE